MRIIGAVYILKDKACLSRLWGRKQIIGSLEGVLKSLDEYHVDEILVINITREEKNEHFGFLGQISKTPCFTPITAGGGIRNYQNFKHYKDASIERIFLTSAIINNKTELIDKCVADMGQQGVIGLIPFRLNNEEIEIFNPSKNKYFTPDIETLKNNISKLDEIAFFDTENEGTPIASQEIISKKIKKIKKIIPETSGLIYGGGITINDKNFIGENHPEISAILIENSLMFCEQPLYINKV